MPTMYIDVYFDLFITVWNWPRNMNIFQLYSQAKIIVYIGAIVSHTSAFQTLQSCSGLTMNLLCYLN